MAEPVPPIEFKPIDQITKVMMPALLAQWQIAYFQKQAQEAIRDAAAQKCKELGEIIAKCKETCKALGFERDAPNWQEVIELFGEDAQRIFEQTRPADVPEHKFSFSKPKEALPELFGEEEQSDQKEVVQKPRPTVREICLLQLAEAGAAGRKASEIRDYMQAEYSLDTHEKTVGMTLYRLLKDGLIRREGHTWFIVPPRAETMNPGVAAPGSEIEQL